MSHEPEGAPLIVVVARTPDQEPERPAPERVRAQRAGARAALARAARFAGCPDTAFEKTSARGKPVPTESGWHWTISHDAQLVAAAVRHEGEVGVDLERIALRRRLLIERVSDAGERAWFGETPDRPLDALGFARLWTTKEAVLKAERIGLPGMPRCRIESAANASLVTASYDGVARPVWQTRVGDELVSASVKGPLPLRVVWIVGR